MNTLEGKGGTFEKHGGIEEKKKKEPKMQPTRTVVSKALLG